MAVLIGAYSAYVVTISLSDWIDCMSCYNTVQQS